MFRGLEQLSCAGRLRELGSFLLEETTLVRSCCSLTAAEGATKKPKSDFYKGYRNKVTRIVVLYNRKDVKILFRLLS